MRIQGSHQSNVEFTNNMMTPPDRQITIGGSGETTINNSNTSTTEVKSFNLLDMLLGRNRQQEEEEEEEQALMNLKYFALMNLKKDKKSVAPTAPQVSGGTVYHNTPERIAIRQQEIDASEAMRKGMPIQEIAKKYPAIADRWLANYGLMNLKPGCLTQDEMLARHYP